MEPISFFVGLGFLIVFVLYIVAVYDVIRNRNRFNTFQTQGLWLMVIIFVPFLGAITYLLLRDRTFARKLQ